LPTETSWETKADNLRRWFLVYLAVWLAGIGLLVAGSGAGETRFADAASVLGRVLFLGCLVPYVISMVYAYKTQASLHTAGLYRHGAWHVVVAALILNPYVFGFYVPLSVLLTARRLRGNLVSRFPPVEGASGPAGAPCYLCGRPLRPDESGSSVCRPCRARLPQ
jgi:hypothetical protein